MYNPDFWEVGVDQADLEQIPNESGIWHETVDEQASRYVWEDRTERIAFRIVANSTKLLTERQREAVLLYFCYAKTQQEIAEILGISRRVVSQHIFGITRKGRPVGGAVQKLRKVCREENVTI